MGRREYLNQISEVAADQGGYITAAQAARTGVPHERLPELVAGGDLRRVRNGVYATRGVSVGPLENTIAAWLSTERERYPWERGGTTPNAVVSHRSAASIWGLGTIIPELPALTTARSARPGRGIEFHRLSVGNDDWRWWRPEGGPELPVTTPARTTARSARPGRGIEFHRLSVGNDDWRWWRPEGGPDLPVTTPARTIVDLLIEREEPSYIERAIREAAAGGLASEAQLLDAARRRRSRNRWLVDTLTRMAAR